MNNWLLCLIAAGALAAPAAAQYASAPGKIGESAELGSVPDVGIEQRLGGDVPLNTPFVAENGETVTLGDCFEDGKPVALAMVYYECPMLCGEVLNGMLNAFRETQYALGDDFTAVTVSFNPEETPALASNKKAAFAEALGYAPSEFGWHFLTGEETSSRKLADALGFAYEYLPETGEYAHGSALIVLTPDGEISKYLPGIQYDGAALDAALLDASAGRIGGVAQQVFFTCFMYDPESGEYTLAIMNIVRAGGGFTIAAIALLVITLLWRDRRRKRRAESAEATHGTVSSPAS